MEKGFVLMAHKNHKIRKDEAHPGSWMFDPGPAGDWYPHLIPINSRFLIAEGTTLEYDDDCNVIWDGVIEPIVIP